MRSIVAQLRLGAPAALVPISLLPVRLIGALQWLAPDWVTAALMSVRTGNPMAHVVAGEGAAQKGAVRKRRVAAAKEP